MGTIKTTAQKPRGISRKFDKKNLREPTIMEISEEIGIPKEDIVYALDAIQNPMSLYEPVYTEGGDTLYVMDQISDKKCKEENWVENISLSEAMKRLDERENEIINLRFLRERHRWRLLNILESLRHKYHGWKKMPCAP